MAIALPMQLPLRSRRQTRIAVSIASSRDRWNAEIAGSRVFRLCQTARRRTWWRWLSSRASARRACLRACRDARARDRAPTHRRGPHKRWVVRRCWLWIRGRTRADRQDSCDTSTETSLLSANGPHTSSSRCSRSAAEENWSSHISSLMHRP